MPLYLRHDAIRLLEASMEALHTAVSGLGVPKRVEFREPAATYAIETGLVGTAVELSMAACLVQAHGPASLQMPSGWFKPAGRIKDDFRDLVRRAAPGSEFLTQEVESPSEHRRKLLSASARFSILIKMRAGGFHAGRGVLRDAACVQAGLVADFLELLAASSRIRPYISGAARCAPEAQVRTVLVDELVRSVLTKTGEEQATALRSIFLVLPEVPEDSPEWLESLERVIAVPSGQDVELLLKVVDEAVPGVLQRVSRSGGTTIPATVRTGDEGALPIAPHRLKKKYASASDSWLADIATANQRLDDEQLVDLPPVDAVWRVFAGGLEARGLLEDDNRLSAHASWVHVLASLHARGTAGPVWFLVHATGDRRQLVARLQTALRHTKQRITSQRVDELVSAIGKQEAGESLPASGPPYADIIRDLEQAQENRQGLLRRFERHQGSDLAVPEDLKKDVSEVADGRQPVGTLLEKVRTTEMSPQARKHWVRSLADASLDLDDVPVLVDLLEDQDGESARTNVRKALRRIDFFHFGPPIGRA